MIHLLKLLLLVEDGDDVSIVITILLCTLSIVEVNQHVSEVLVQSRFNIISTLLLGPLLLLGLGLRMGLISMRLRLGGRLLLRSLSVLLLRLRLQN